jgi:hypothetical protein
MVIEVELVSAELVLLEQPRTEQQRIVGVDAAPDARFQEGGERVGLQ